MKANRRTAPGAMLLWLVIPALVIVITVVVRRSPSPNREVGQPAAVMGETNVLSVADSSAAAPPQGSLAMTNAQGVPLRPLAVVKETATHQWTAEDARDTNVIRQLAHNDAEYRRLVEENRRIKRRQLVYRKETVPELLQRARGVGQQLQSFTLPGLDGREIEVEVMQTKVNGVAQSGSVNGRVKGRYGSMVSVGFFNGCESFNIISPEDGLYLTADAREPGEVMVKEIDPDTYSPPAGNTPDYILTDESVPNSRPAISNSK